jgi:hypothetical protein
VDFPTYQLNSNRALSHKIQASKVAFRIVDQGSFLGGNVRYMNMNSIGGEMKATILTNIPVMNKPSGRIGKSNPSNAEATG